MLWDFFMMCIYHSLLWVMSPFRNLGFPTITFTIKTFWAWLIISLLLEQTQQQQHWDGDSCWWPSIQKYKVRSWRHLPLHQHENIILIKTLPSDQVQEELSRVIGSRQVQVEDRKNLPFLDAVIHETQRLANIVPMALPHKTSQDVTFQGHFIKKVRLNITTHLKDSDM